MKRAIILAINPGTTTTRCATYSLQGNSLSLHAERNLDHAEDDLSGFATIADQLDYRAACVREFLCDALDDQDRLVSVSGRGGMPTPVATSAKLWPKERCAP